MPLGPGVFVDLSLVDQDFSVLTPSPFRVKKLRVSESVVVVVRYLPFQSVHGPYEAPMSFVELYNKTIVTENRRIHQGMVTALDQARPELPYPRACCCQQFTNAFGLV